MTSFIPAPMTAEMKAAARARFELITSSLMQNFKDLARFKTAAPALAIEYQRMKARLETELEGLPAALPNWQTLAQLQPLDFEALCQQARAHIALGKTHKDALDLTCPASQTFLRENMAAALKDAPTITQPQTRARHIAICGIAFCGSTLLDRIMGGMDGQASIGESHRMTGMYDERKATVPMDYSTPEPGRVAYCTICRAKCETWTHEWRRSLASDSTSWYFKLASRMNTPVLISADKNIKLLLRNDPLLRFDALILFKSPERAWLSRLIKLPEGKPKSFYTDWLYRYMKVWQVTYEHYLNTIEPAGRKVFLCHEMFSEAPEVEFQRICAGLDLAYTPQALKQSQPGHAIGGNGRTHRTLRATDYKIEIEPLPSLDIPQAHLKWIQENEELQNLYSALKARCI